MPARNEDHEMEDAPVNGNDVGSPSAEAGEEELPTEEKQRIRVVSL